MSGTVICFEADANRTDTSSANRRTRSLITRHRGFAGTNAPPCPTTGDECHTRCARRSAGHEEASYERRWPKGDRRCDAASVAALKAAKSAPAAKKSAGNKAA